MTLTLDERLFIVKTYYQTGNSAAETLRKFGTAFGLAKKPDRKTVSR